VPLIELFVPEGALEPEARDRLVEELTTTLLRWEGAPVNDVSRAISWGYVHEVPAGHQYVGGRPLDGGEPRYRLKITVPEGALDDRRKAGLVEDATRLVLAAEGGPDDEAAAFRVWVTIREVADGNWGAAGRIFRLRDIAQAVGARSAQPV
jgi:phenylpyruvate tautomerase PptA (4-oxalocrotonate tautomerase family)